MISYRNHKNTNIAFNPGTTIIWGKNGSGKTSILEAIHCLSIGNSFRTNNKKELITEGFDQFILNGVFKNKSGLENKISFSYNKKGIKKIKINREEIKTRKELIGLNNVVVLSPEEEAITKGGPSERRKFFDRVFSMTSRRYLECLLQYNKILQQRNATLRNDSTKKMQKQIEIWNNPFADVALNLWKERKELLLSFIKTFVKTTNSLGVGVTCNIGYEQKNLQKKKLLEKLRKTEKKDIALGFTGIGPHRDDFVFEWGEKKIKNKGSQGEHKVFLSLLKITEVVFLSKKTNKNPVFLLDDLFANLDVRRSKKLLSFIEDLKLNNGSKPQTIITTTDLMSIQKESLFSNYGKITKIRL